MQLDAKSREVVLESLRSAIPFRRHEMIDILERMHAAGAPTTLRAFLDESGLELEDVYAPQRCFRDLLEEASITERIRGPFERELRSAIGRLLHVDDLARLDGYATCLRRGDASSTQPTATARLTQMLVGSMLSRTPKLDKSTLLAAGLDILRAHEAVCDELGQLFELLRERITHVHEPLGSHPDCPLQIHARYTRVEILAAFGERSGFTKIPAWQTGVRWLSKAKADLLAFTIDKSTGGFSPTTRYRDYAISPELIHWESQSVVREASETGQRYQAHAARGSHVMLFARESTATKHYWFLGPARYVSHSGECPMGITWRLEHPLPGDVFAALSAVA